MCMRIERLNVIKSCAGYDADPRPCRCFTCRAEYSCDSGDSDLGNVDEVEWWEQNDRPDSLDSSEDARMKKKRMNMQPKKTSKPKKAKKPLKKHSEMSGPEVCGKIKHSVMTNMWNQAVRRAYIDLGFSGFVPLGGTTHEGHAFLRMAKMIYSEWKPEEERLFGEVQGARAELVNVD